MKCNYCKNKLHNLDTCKFCHFEYDEDYTPCNDSKWDILHLNDNEQWSHIQIMDRLHIKGIDCISADIWCDNNIAIIIGSTTENWKIADALGVHEEVIYNNWDHCLIILNLFQEKIIRGLEE